MAKKGNSGKSEEAFESFHGVTRNCHDRLSLQCTHIIQYVKWLSASNQ